jgi:hypothetical protein
MLTMNNEPAESLQNPGPPDQSIAHSSPGFGIMGFNALYGNNNFQGDTYWRAHLVLNLSFPNPINGGLPFIAFGASSARGNSRYIGALNPTAGVPSFLHFDARLWDANLPQPIPPQPANIVSYVQIFAGLGSQTKGVNIALFHEATDGYPGPPSSVGWDWPYQESAYYPGAEFASIQAEDVSGYCGMSVPSLALSQDVHYSIDLQKSFKCLSDHGLFKNISGVNDPLPSSSNFPITIVNWANEGAGVNGDLWTDVHNMKMTTSL